jgi:type I restriction enzyme R subunit
MAPSNFDFLREHDPLFLQLATAAERAFSSDPNTTLIKLRQLGEALAQDVAARSGITFDSETTQADLLFRLQRDLALEPTIRQLFHTLRIEGNKATHQFHTQHREAIDGLRVARSLAIWYHQSFGKQGSAFKPGPFMAPSDPSAELHTLRQQIEQLQARLAQAGQQSETQQQLTTLLDREKNEYAQLAEQMDEEARTFEQLAREAEQKLAQQQHAFETRIQALQQQLDTAQTKPAADKVRKAAQQVDLDEDLTRILIDQQLMDAGWEADSTTLTFELGARPERGRNLAIAEWPAQGGRADYILFAGLTPIAVVEAKRKRVNVPGCLPQAERYASTFKPVADLVPAWQVEGRTIAWPDNADGHYTIPFVYACNGRSFIRQLAEMSGTWFRDLRDPAGGARPLQDFHSPDGLLDLLKRNREAAEQKLRDEPFAYLKLRDYQQRAIVAVENALHHNQRHCLMAMATGTGKTRTILGLIYRLLKAERFHRILFLVDRTALGTQALDVFNEAPLEQNLPLSKIYNIAQLGDMAAEAETRVQVATVQAMVRRVLQSDTPLPVDTYDCIVVDEAHRGYTLDQEMSEGELAVRDHAQYLSQYRQVLDYFDAVRIGLTATPAKQTSEIFGKPVFTYSYREAVADDWLIDHEPPIRYETLLSRQGIHFDKGDKVSAIDVRSGEVEIAELDDELDFAVEAFNRRVITENFNRVICEELAEEIDPFGEEKTMIFCATDLHADMVKRLLDDAFIAKYNGEYNQLAVQKLTGRTDQIDQKIRQYKNERYPTIAITVDLLTTGIDVPRICNIVFLRRVRSRILYEQMVGRATRRCDEIGKTVFRIFDPVDIYAALQDVSTMQPLVKNPNITLEQLEAELLDPKSFEAPGNQTGTTHANDVLDALSQKVMRVLRKATKKAEQKPALKQKLDELEQLWGVPPAQLHTHLHKIGPRQAAEFIRTHGAFTQQLDTVAALLGSEYRPLISDHPDAIQERNQSYGKHQRPSDYLESFEQFIRAQINQSVALSVVVNRPKDLTREQLREIRLLLDEHGYSEASLQTAWRNQTNRDIAAGIVAHIRRAALGEALIPFDERVRKALEKIYGLHTWSPVQRKWLERIGKALVHDTLIDRDYLNRNFPDSGGAKGLDRALAGQLDQVMDELNAKLWDAG